MKPHLHQLAEAVGATVLGEVPVHFLFSTAELERFVQLAAAYKTIEMARLADQLERAGVKKVDLTL